ncbi:potassium channel family protein [Streptomyces catenulae]|uniref:Potassium channel family protein n=1 Tax=Streptomyces catenulae TaxID=66875 RepID=A0ABV2YWE6_9ACTN|nr:potassium channel family protein [Streptomyces catenulae]
MDRNDRLAAWERRADPYLLAASLLFLLAYAVRVLEPGMSPAVRACWAAVTALTWACFIAEYLTRLALSPDRRRFVRTRWLDLLVVVLPLLRPLRLVETHDRQRLRHRRPRLVLEARVMAYAGLSALLLGFAAALAVLHEERSAPGSGIHDLGDAVWWAVAALTTTGYGDATPVTARGRTVGAGLMFVGVALVGAVVGAFSSWLVRRFRQEGEE